MTIRGYLVAPGRDLVCVWPFYRALPGFAEFDFAMLLETRTFQTMRFSERPTRAWFGQCLPVAAAHRLSFDLIPVVTERNAGTHAKLIRMIRLFQLDLAKQGQHLCLKISSNRVKTVMLQLQSARLILEVFVNMRFLQTTSLAFRRAKSLGKPLDMHRIRVWSPACCRAT